MDKCTCSIDSCDKPMIARGYCPMHYRRFRLYGDPLLTRVIRGDDETRFWSKVDAADCWEWTGGKDPEGYGRFRLPSGWVRAHRWAWEHFVGPIPERLVLDHLCRNRGCVNPEHLEPVTVKVNVLRGTSFVSQNVAKTHCPKGHPYDEHNTIHRNGRRVCRACERGRYTER